MPKGMGYPAKPASKKNKMGMDYGYDSMNHGQPKASENQQKYPGGYMPAEVKDQTPAGSSSGGGSKRKGY